MKTIIQGILIVAVAMSCSNGIPQIGSRKTSNKTHSTSKEI